jgi:CO dehydrogenase nickel-insertion accessory protein CooC1
MNKPQENEFYTSCVTQHSKKILGEIPLDDALLSYTFEDLQPETIKSAKEIIEKISKLKKRGNLSSL